ncbi:hypothetical protein Clacol_001168 [Clathrus columnatus]|uniref:Uncharacterized protein n=1 Tax=Clathrus columnatus TaxID=1419009 RepID=A0AAV5A501_9AGAM|nr:hypothetical protein Clacol_001168 [Clathrus columnatus]
MVSLSSPSTLVKKPNSKMANYDVLPLDPALYYLDPRLARLFKQSTGYRNEADLKAHILRIQADAYAMCPYPCIRLFSFTQLAVTEYPYYKSIIRQGRLDPNAILLEIGVGFGNDIRKMIYDGYPIEKVVVMDKNQKLWEIGHRLFCSTPRTFPVKFIRGDIFDQSVLSDYTSPSLSQPNIHSLDTLTPLKEHATTITLQMVFHLFDLKRQYLLAKRVASLLSSAPNSLIVGRQMGDATPRTMMLGKSPHFIHNPESWERMWSDVFPKGSVEYRTALVDLPPHLRSGSSGMLGISQFLVWSIRRL